MIEHDGVWCFYRTCHADELKRGCERKTGTYYISWGDETNLVLLKELFVFREEAGSTESSEWVAPLKEYIYNTLKMTLHP